MFACQGAVQKIGFEMNKRLDCEEEEEGGRGGKREKLEEGKREREGGGSVDRRAVDGAKTFVQRREGEESGGGRWCPL